jgi:DNA-binding SARP family transcriptional activator
MDLRLLEGFELRRGGEVVSLSGTVQRLLAFLGLRARPQHRSVVAGSLWMDTTEDRALASLRTALWQVRRAGRDLVEAKGNYLRLGPRVRVDVVDLVARTRRLLDDRVTIDLRDVEMSPVELSDDLLPEWYEDWVLLERERLRQICLHGLEALSRRLGSLGLHAQAVEAGLAAVGVEPLRESAQRALIEAHLAEGNASEAIRQFDRYAVLLEQELGIRPGESLRSLLPTGR